MTWISHKYTYIPFIFFSIVGAPFYIPINSAELFPFLYILSNTLEKKSYPSLQVLGDFISL